MLVFPKDGVFFLVPHFFLPGDELRERARRDNVPYDLWASQGLIHLTPGNQDSAFFRTCFENSPRLRWTNSSMSHRAAITTIQSYASELKTKYLQLVNFRTTPSM